MTKLKRISGLHHYAYRCRNAEETRSFYEDLLGLPLAHVIQADSVPSTGASDPYVHLFFEYADGSYIAFFDLGDETACTPDPETPSWVNHFAMQVGTVAEVEEIVPVGTLDKMSIHTPGVYVQRIFQGSHEKRIEQRTTRAA